jgi:hypothetical protein
VDRRALDGLSCDIAANATLLACIAGGKVMRCEYTWANETETCQFSPDMNAPMFRIAGKTFCVFHAPLDAVEISDPELQKRNFSTDQILEFNQRVLHYAQSISAIESDHTAPNRTASGGMAKRLKQALEELIRRGLTNLTGVVFPGTFDCDGVRWLDVDFTNAVFHG